MNRLALLLLAATASCGSSSLTDADPPDATLPAAQSDADCLMFNPTACRLDLAKTSVGIDVNYPNLAFCRLQLLPTKDPLGTALYSQLASSWQVTMTNAARDQTVLAPETPQGVLEYPLGTQQLYLTRVTFASKSSDTLATLVANALGPDVSLYAVGLECPGRR
jgi:hypothetical protein